MKVFLAGATGVIGRSLVPRLIGAGHTVTAMTRDVNRAKQLASQGAAPVVCDVYDSGRVEAAVARAKADAVIHQLTSLPKAIDPRRIERQLADNDRIRTEGTRNLVRAATLAGVGRIIAQSVSFAYAPEGGRVKSEDAPLWLGAPRPWRRTVEALAELERQVRSNEGVQGVILRYGYFYGTGSAFAADGAIADLVRRHRYPVAGGGSGVFSFVHINDAASATVSALEYGEPGTYNIVDDEPAMLRDWLPVYAEALGAPKPRKVPSFVARLAAGRYGLYLMTEQRGASNARAKKELAWAPSFATWRAGFGEALRTTDPTDGHKPPGS